MIRYLDTSVLVPFYVKEIRTGDAQNWLDGLGNSSLWISPWCIAEFSSALGIKYRRGELAQADLSIVKAGFHWFVTTRTRVMEVITTDFYRAAELCDLPQLGLRAGDALHLSITERCGFTIVLWTKVCRLRLNPLGCLRKPFDMT